MSRILLILDLDETLIHATEKELETTFDFKIFDYFVYKRPFLDEFLNFCHTNFDLAVWSSASDDYVKLIVQQVFPQNIALQFVWSRNQCTLEASPEIDEFGNYYLDVNSHYQYIKKLKKVKNKGFDLDRVLIVDDTPSKVINSFGNAIYINEFVGNKSDNELFLLAKYLLTFIDIENVRNIEKRGWRTTYLN